AEVAQALGNDPNFATTVMDSIGRRVKTDDPRLSDAREPLPHEQSMDTIIGLGYSLMVKSDRGHSHSLVEISRKPSTYAPSPHDHSIGQVSGLEDALGGKSDDGHTHTPAEVGLGNVDNTADVDKPVSSDQQAALAGKADVSHVDARPAMWLWDGQGSWTAPAAANDGDSVLNLSTSEIHSITEV